MCLGPIWLFQAGGKRGNQGRQRKNLTSRKELHGVLYRPIRESFYAKYTAGAITCAKSKLKLYRTAKKTHPNARRPCVKNNVLLLDNQSYKIRDGHMEIPTKPKEPWLKIPLCQYVLKTLGGMKLGSITITPHKTNHRILKGGQNHRPGTVDRNRPQP